ncbi:MAG: cytochrome c-type biogenesis protein CcmH [Gallionellaceae bacterium]|jgi:cytochrome c-type biogenesis protein CcmH|nr:cytochrome c-type biogenesis protein CcmH [Gallionellaceae bacterium]
MKRLLMLSLLCLLPLSAWADEAKDLAEDPVVEKRLIALATDLRCVQCQNESLASSRAGIAQDMRREIRELIKQDKSDQEIKDWLVSRYGDFVMYQPPFKSYTLFLWLGPFALLLVGAIILYSQIRKRRNLTPEAGLSADATRRADALLNMTKDTQA